MPAARTIAGAAGRPAAKKAPTRPGAAVPSEDGWLRPGSLPLKAMRLAFRHPVRVAGGALFVTLTVACLWNPLMAQRGKHPAPLFGPKPAAAAPERRAEAPPSTAVAVQPAPLPAPRPDPLTVASIAAATAPSEPERGLDRTAMPRPGRETAKPAAAKPDPAKADVVKPDASRIAAAQRTLTRLGYGPVDADGLMGPGTRAAIERFEKARKVPVTGVLGGRTAKLLGVADS